MAAVNPLPPLLMVSGKGGVGKTTLAATLALLCHQRGERVLLVSSDPAHNLCDLFALPATRKEVSTIKPGFYLQELSPDQELDDYLAQAKERIAPLLPPTSQRMLGRYLDFVRCSPGGSEAAIFHRLAQLVSERQRGDWQRLICDTAPSGHTLQLLKLPAQMDQWGDLLDRQRQKQEQLQRFMLDSAVEPSRNWLAHRRQLYHNFRHQLSDPSASGVILVLEAQSLALAETQRTARELCDQGVRPYAICLNRLLPDSASESIFYQRRREVESEYRQRIETSLSAYPHWHLKLQERDIDHRNLADLAVQLEPQLNWAS